MMDLDFARRLHAKEVCQVGALLTQRAQGPCLQTIFTDGVTPPKINGWNLEMMVKPIGISKLPRGPHFQVPCLFWGVYLLFEIIRLLILKALKNPDVGNTLNIIHAPIFLTKKPSIEISQPFKSGPALVTLPPQEVKAMDDFDITMKPFMRSRGETPATFGGTTFWWTPGGPLSTV